MASSISNSDAELKVVWAQAGKLSLSAPVSFEDANGFDEALEVVGSDPNVLIGAVEAQRRDTTMARKSPARGDIGGSTSWTVISNSPSPSARIMATVSLTFNVQAFIRRAPRMADKTS